MVRYGFLKPSLDAHTLGVNSAAELLRECGYEVLIADDDISKALNDYKHEARRKVVVEWVLANKITRIGLSYRLDPIDAVEMVGYFVEELRKLQLFKYQGGPLQLIFFGGLPQACELIDKKFDGLVTTFMGGESVTETLVQMGVPKERIPVDIYQGSRYDETLHAFGKEIIQSQEYLKYRPLDRSGYPEYGTREDSVVKRIAANREHAQGPLVRAHVGPYFSDADRMESVRAFVAWAKELARTGYLDILSIGSSQLTQSNFGEDWAGKANGGGVPINSPEEYRMIWEASRPLLVRTYAGTRDVPSLAKMHEETLNICWHALSLWWFNQLDKRGPYDLCTNLEQHIETLAYIAKTNKPFEANVSHHFAFRGADDVTYLVSAYLAAKLAKKMGIKTFILQNMLNTPRLTWGIQDLAKSRALLGLIRGLEDQNFRVLLQPRAGLDYFKPDLTEARIQLAQATALMDDIEPHNEASPPIIHVVSFSEASHLATPDVINESIQITQYSLMRYRELRRRGEIDDLSKNEDVAERAQELTVAAKKMIAAIEALVEDPYSAAGFYKIFAAGFLPVPYLWGEGEEFVHAKAWRTKPVKGGMRVVDRNERPMDAEEIIAIARDHLKDAEFNLKQRAGCLRI